MSDLVLVVTPARNAAEYLDETILSIVQQRGEFATCFHVQDGGSTDATVEHLKHWAGRLVRAEGSLEGGAQVRMSWASAPDRSMYDAIQTGFDTLHRSVEPLDGRRVVMTWINADDIFAPGAFHTATRFLRDNPQHPWVTGIPSTMAEDGTIADVRDAPYGYSRPHLALGRYDGRSRPFVQQEGTFWTHRLWRDVGGLNRDLTLAGDWDLWRRMARHAGVVTLRAVLAHHRRRAGQLTSEMHRYYAEVDALLESAGEGPAEMAADRDVALIAGWLLDQRHWSVYEAEIRGAQEMPDRNGRRSPRAMRLEFSCQSLPLWVRDASGLSEAESWGRWSDDRLAPSIRLCFLRPLPRQAMLRLRMAVLDPRCNPVMVTVGTEAFAFHAATKPGDFECQVTLQVPTQTVDIRAARSFAPLELGWSEDSRRLAVALHWLELTTLES